MKGENGYKNAFPETKEQNPDKNTKKSDTKEKNRDTPER